MSNLLDSSEPVRLLVVTSRNISRMRRRIISLAVGDADNEDVVRPMGREGDGWQIGVYLHPPRPLRKGRPIPPDALSLRHEKLEDGSSLTRLVRLPRIWGRSPSAEHMNPSLPGRLATGKTLSIPERRNSLTPNHYQLMLLTECKTHRAFLPLDFVCGPTDHPPTAPTSVQPGFANRDCGERTCRPIEGDSIDIKTNNSEASNYSGPERELRLRTSSLCR